MAATIKIADGYEWSNSLLDPNTFEWQDLADKIKREVCFLDLRGVAGGGRGQSPRNLADKLTPFEPEWADFAPHITASPPAIHKCRPRGSGVS